MGYAALHTLGEALHSGRKIRVTIFKKFLSRNRFKSKK
jgi:hypothetical protein